MTFSVTVVSLTQVTYQWYCGNTSIPDATGASLTLNSVSSKNAGSYYVNLVNGGGSVNSGAATLTVTYSAPTANDNSYSVLENVSKTVAAPGVLANDTDPNGLSLSAVLASNVSHGALSLNANGGFTYLPGTNYFGTDSFSYLATDGMATSSVATVALTILAPPTITNQPQSQVVANNTNASFSVGAYGSATLHYQWWFGNSALSGATSSTLTINPAQTNNDGNYWVVVTNSEGSVTSAVATLNVASAPIASTSGASNITTNAATLNALINPQGLLTTYVFMYGTTTNYGSATAEISILGGLLNVAVSVNITGLSPGTTYHYCVVATSLSGVSTGPDQVFTTAFPPPLASALLVTNVTAGSATLGAMLNPLGTTAGYYFQYGVTTNNCSCTATNNMIAGMINSLVGMSVTGLASGTKYYYSMVAVSSGGTTVTTNGTFTTLSIPAVQLNGAPTPLGQGQKRMQLSLTSVTGATFTVLGSKDLVHWASLGTMTETSPGQYVFTDSELATNPSCYYRLESQ